MFRWLKNLTIYFTVAAISAMALCSPVFAAPADPPADAPAVITPGDGSPADTATPEEMEDGEEDEDEAGTATATTCYDQVGGISWLVCPGASFLVSFIDFAYGVIENLLRVNPLPNNPQSPIYIVWEYARDITNLIFVIFFLVIIFSQITGLGINNYGIKRMLPRLIVAAILINISYTICTLTVDLSNILGGALRDVFQNIQEAAIANGEINETVSNTSFASIVSSIIGIGAVGTIIFNSTIGGPLGAIYFILPIIFSGAIALLSAVVTLAARQAFVFLLVMIAPAAFVCYLLPNTDKWFQKWYNTFFRMIFFYPMFSVLYGASQLAGFITITSASDWLGIILGIAIQVLPLFLSVPLMRMSGSVLGGISGIINSITNPARGAIFRYSEKGVAAKRSDQLSSTSPLLSSRLARWREKRRAQRDFDTQDAMDLNKRLYMTYAVTSMIEGKDRKHLNRRGIRHYNYNQRREQLEADYMNFQTDMDEGFENGSAAGLLPITRAIGNNKIRRINEALEGTIVDSHIAKARQHSVARSNMERRANLIRDALSDEQNRTNTQIYEQVTSAFRYESAPAAGSQEELRVKRAVNDVLADAISQKRRVDSDMKNMYLELYDDAPAGKYIKTQLEEAFKIGDYNSASAAMLTMAKRGDHGDLIRTMVDHSHEFADNFAMQKSVADTSVTLKNNNLILWAWAKSNMIRRSMSEENDTRPPDESVASYIDLGTFIKGGYMQGDGAQSHERLNKTSLKQIFNDLNGWSAIATQDRTVFKELLSLIKDGKIPIPQDTAGNDLSYPILFPEKFIRSTLASGLIDGEQLGTIDAFITGGFNIKKYNNHQSQDQFFYDHGNIIKQNIISQIEGMTTGQLISHKTATLMDYNAALLTLEPDQIMQIDVDGQTMNVSSILYNAFEKQRTALNKPNSIVLRGNVNKTVRQMLGIRLD